MDIYQLAPGPRKAFLEAVWLIARQIPAGKVAAYGQIAAYIPKPPGISDENYRAFRPRWAGSAMAGCPADVPWQRVINAQGKVSPRPGAEMQRALLEGEGVHFDAKDRVDFKIYGWEGPSAEWLRENHLVGLEVG
jgi:methylated-DNA-protein-cysteine methyltransferase-like protein